MLQYLRNLEQIGLNVNQAKTYLACLELGQTTVIKLAQKTGIIRTTIYDNLRALKEYGLVTETVEGGRRMFIAESPAKLANILEAKKQTIEESLPALMEIFNSAKAKPKIQFFHGVKGIMKIHEMSNQENPAKKNLILGDLNAEFSWLSREQRLPYKRERIKRAIRNYTLSTNTLAEIKKFSNYDPDRHKRDLREIKMTPAALSIPFLFYSWHDKVAIFSSSREGYAMVIESPEFTAGFKSLFDFLWQLSQTIEPKDLVRN